MSIYTEMGYESRKDYLQSLAEEHEVGYDVVLTLARILGPEEDYDGLVTAIEDYVESQGSDYL